MNIYEFHVASMIRYFEISKQNFTHSTSNNYQSLQMTYLTTWSFENKSSPKKIIQ